MVAFLTLRLFAWSDMGRCVGVRDGLAALLEKFFQVSVAGHALHAGDYILWRRLLMATLARKARLHMSLEAGGRWGRLPGIMQGHYQQGTNKCEND
jgi:hypothetical protein